MIDIDTIRGHVDQIELDSEDTEYYGCEICVDNQRALLAEVKRNTCGCGHAMADHLLSTGAIVQCILCKDDDGHDYKDCFECDLRANGPAPTI